MRKQLRTGMVPESKLLTIGRRCKGIFNFTWLTVWMWIKIVGLFFYILAIFLWAWITGHADDFDRI
jgi:hypothetical protein